MMGRISRCRIDIIYRDEADLEDCSPFQRAMHCIDTFRGLQRNVIFSCKTG